ncbi:hydantoinase B/oxoprolinase family protein [uncultured Erythrobacter sp.]|uniref:hydantoinase B/oxoprolinase family protein n=1 Tax=uncultured Erythrobacter sp. TaxID=263913 RepID=UPI00261D3BA4|nr:hydantoinase B/oxoprolinase family protein [uncultured Erythrobacter sp.]
MTASPVELHGAQLAVLIARLEGIARKMTNTLFRTGRSGVLNRARDFSCCIVTANHELIASADALPIHVLIGPDMMSVATKEFHPNLVRGDAFLNNSPYHGCSHAADHTILVPVFDDTETHRFTVLVKAHQADIGNAAPTTYRGDARDMYEEGALIFPSVKFQSGYEDIDDIVRMCRMRIRVPDQWHGDFRAMMGAARIGEREVEAMGRDVGWSVLQAFAEQWLDYSETLMSEAIARLPAAESTGASRHDPMPGTPPEGVEIKARVAIDPTERRIAVDLRENPDCLPCGLNLSEACSRTSALVGIFNSIGGGVPRNAGSFRRVDIQLRENCVTGIPLHPTSCSVATTNIADRVTHAVELAIARVAEGHGQAECGAAQPPSCAVVSGTDPRTGTAFINQLFLGCTVGAGTPWGDAWLTYTHVGNGGMSFIDSVEIDELHHPICVFERRLMPDTEGAGTFIGAQSLKVAFGPVGCDLEVSYVSDGVHNPPMGARGGGTGGAAGQYRIDANGNRHELDGCASVVLGDGEQIVSISAGGGGYGDPRRRETGLVERDVEEGLLSPERARRVYGFCIDDASTASTPAAAHEISGENQEQGGGNV